MARSKLSRDKVCRAALALIDEGGLDALTMRRLGEALGVKAMSLYRHVSHKADLLDGVQGLILTKLTPASSSTWRPWIRNQARAFRDLLRKHPRALPLFTTRPAVERVALVHVERALAILQEAGFTATQCIYVFHTVIAFVVGSASLQFGIDEDLGPDIDYTRLPEQDFPSLAHIGALFDDIDDDEEFEFGLEALIVGLKSGLKKRRKGKTP